MPLNIPKLSAKQKTERQYNYLFSRSGEKTIKIERTGGPKISFSSIDGKITYSRGFQKNIRVYSTFDLIMVIGAVAALIAAFFSILSWIK